MQKEESMRPHGRNRGRGASRYLSERAWRQLLSPACVTESIYVGTVLLGSESRLRKISVRRIVSPMRKVKGWLMATI